LLLDLEGDRMDDEEYLRVCWETGRTHDLAERLLSLGRVEEVSEEARQASDFELRGLADLLVRHGGPSSPRALSETGPSAPTTPGSWSG
jgi:hypothetical protein